MLFRSVSLVKIGDRPEFEEHKKRKRMENMDKMMNMMSKLITEVKEMRRDQQKINENFKKLEFENDVLRGENLEMGKKIIELKVRTEELERREKKNNIIVNGLEVKTNDNEIMKKEIERFIKDRLEVKIEKCYKKETKLL